MNVPGLLLYINYSCASVLFFSTMTLTIVRIRVTNSVNPTPRKAISIPTTGVIPSLLTNR